MMSTIKGSYKVDQQPKPVRRMSDIGPRRTLDLRQPQPNQAPSNAPQPAASAQPQAQTAPVAPQPVVRSSEPQSRPAAPAAAAPHQRAAAGPAPVHATKAPKPHKEPRQSGVWKVVVQFIIGFLVIAGVASAIVYLYLKYYS